MVSMEETVKSLVKLIGLNPNLEGLLDGPFWKACCPITIDTRRSSGERGDSTEFTTLHQQKVYESTCSVFTMKKTFFSFKNHLK
jgi:hypothetical protein